MTIDDKLPVLTPAQLRRVLDIEYDRQIPFGAAVDIFYKEKREWEREKLAKENKAQEKEIEVHKWLESEKKGYDLGYDAASKDWIAKHAKPWRIGIESFENNAFERLEAVLENKTGLHLRPSSYLAEIAACFDCKIYAHREGLLSPEIIVADPGLDFKELPFVRVNANVLGVMSISAVRGDLMKFIAYGRKAKEAIETVRTMCGQQYEDWQKILDKCKNSNRSI